MRLLKDKGYKQVSLSVQKANYAVKMYQKIGFVIVDENVKLRKWYEADGAEHIGTEKYDFFPFTCGYMKKML